MILLNDIDSGSEATGSISTDTSDIDNVTDGTNLSTDGTENDDRGSDDTEGISSTSTYDS